jgi:K+/H+ antiporter YhaU regulatory subunit KhtT
VVQVDLRIREQKLPGIGHRYELALDDDRYLLVVVQHTGDREVGVMRSGAEEPDVVVSLDHDESLAVAALLTGARFAVDTSGDERVPADEIAVETITLGPRSPVIGQLVDEVALPLGSDATILAVIRDEPAQLVEDEPVEPFRRGDQVVVSAPRDRLPEVARRLAG